MVDSRYGYPIVIRSNPLAGVVTMLRKEVVPDKTIVQKINQRLVRAGLGSGSRVTVTVCGGQVTLSGTLQYEVQRRPTLRAVGCVEGVRGIADRMQVKPSGSHWR